MARFTSAVTGVDSGQMERGNSSIPHPLVNAKEVFTLHIRVCSITRSLTIQSKIYHFCGLRGTRFETFATRLGEYLEALTSSVTTCMMTLHIDDVLMQQKWYHFTSSLKMQHLVARSFIFHKSEKFFNSMHAFQ